MRKFQPGAISPIACEIEPSFGRFVAGKCDVYGGGAVRTKIKRER